MELLGFPRKMITSEVIFQIAGKLLHFTSSIALPFTFGLNGRTHTEQPWI